MQRDVLLLTEMIDAVEQTQALANGLSAEDLAADRQRRDALLWNFTVLGEAASQLSDEISGAVLRPDKEPVPANCWQGYWAGASTVSPAAAAASASRLS
jgi:uncharacterized protein with HEPN domain